jgi:hypothetical protein
MYLNNKIRKKYSSRVVYNFINGEMKQSKSNKSFAMLDPSNG